jgi:hypothetical protein
MGTLSRKLGKSCYSRKGSRIPILLAIYPVLSRLDNTYPFKESHALIATTAGVYGIRVVDLLPYFASRDPSGLWARDNSHPNAMANGIAARGIYEALLAHRFSRRPLCLLLGAPERLPACGRKL